MHSRRCLKPIKTQPSHLKPLVRYPLHHLFDSPLSPIRRSKPFRNTIKLPNNPEIVSNVPKDLPNKLNPLLILCRNDQSKELWHHVARTLKTHHIKSTHQLIVDLSICDELKTKDLKNYNLSVSKFFPHLSKLTFTLPSSVYLTDQDLLWLAQGLKNHGQRLKELSLDFSWYQNVSEKGFSHLIRQVGKTFPHLELLSIRVSGLSDKCLKSLSKNLLKNLKKLKQFCFFPFSFEKVTNQAFKEFTHALGTHPKDLQQLNLKFSDLQQISDDSLQYLNNHMFSGCLKNLLLLEFSLSWNLLITDKAIVNFLLSIQENLENLQDLSLGFLKFQNLSFEGFGDFSNQKNKSIKRLKRLHIDIRYCPKIQGKGIRSLTRFICNNAYALESLYIDFSECQGINDLALNILSQNLSETHLVKLQQLFLIFNYCKDITSEDVKLLRFTIREKLPQIKPLNIKFTPYHLPERDVENLEIVEDINPKNFY